MLPALTAQMNEVKQELASFIEDLTECRICNVSFDHDKKKRVRYNPCNHSMCIECAQSWFKRKLKFNSYVLNTDCDFCRGRIVGFKIDNSILEVKDSLDKTAKKIGKIQEDLLAFESSTQKSKGLKRKRGEKVELHRSKIPKYQLQQSPKNSNIGVFEPFDKWENVCLGVDILNNPTFANMLSIVNLNKNSPIKKIELLENGLNGSAWVRVRFENADTPAIARLLSEIPVTGLFFSEDADWGFCDISNKDDMIRFLESMPIIDDPKVEEFKQLIQQTLQ